MILQYKEEKSKKQIVLFVFYFREKQSASYSNREKESLQTNVRHLVYETNEYSIDFIYFLI
jgi:tRNA(Ile)-lysidine synthase TilS/MesJ